MRARFTKGLGVYQKKDVHSMYRLCIVTCKFCSRETERERDERGEIEGERGERARERGKK